MKSFTISLLVFILYMMASCRTEYIPVESVRYDSIYLAKLQKDSIFVKDSICIREKGDTIFRDKLKYIYRYIARKDTVYIERKDSIQIPYPVERKLTRWQQMKNDFGEMASLAIIVYIIYLLVKWMVMRTRKQ